MAPSTATQGPTTASAAEVGGEVVFSARVTADDAEANSPSVLAFTGGSSTPIVVAGIVLLILGATLSAVSRQRRQTS